MQYYNIRAGEYITKVCATSSFKRPRTRDPRPRGTVDPADRGAGELDGIGPDPVGNAGSWLHVSCSPEGAADGFDGSTSLAGAAPVLFVDEVPILEAAAGDFHAEHVPHFRRADPEHGRWRCLRGGVCFRSSHALSPVDLTRRGFARRLVGAVRRGSERTVTPEQEVGPFSASMCHLVRSVRLGRCSGYSDSHQTDRALDRPRGDAGYDLETIATLERPSSG